MPAPRAALWTAAPASQTGHRGWQGRAAGSAASPARRDVMLLEHPHRPARFAPGHCRCCPSSATCLLHGDQGQRQVNYPRGALGYGRCRQVKVGEPAAARSRSKGARRERRRWEAVVMVDGQGVLDRPDRLRRYRQRGPRRRALDRGDPAGGVPGPGAQAPLPPGSPAAWPRRAGALRPDLHLPRPAAPARIRPHGACASQRRRRGCRLAGVRGPRRRRLPAGPAGLR